MKELLLRLLTVVVDGLVVAIPLLLMLLRVYVNERKAKAEAKEAKEARDVAEAESEIWKAEHKNAMKNPQVDDHTAIAHGAYTEVKEAAKKVVAERKKQ